MLAAESLYPPYEAKTAVFGVIKVVLGLTWCVHYSNMIYEWKTQERSNCVFGYEEASVSLPNSQYWLCLLVQEVFEMISGITMKWENWREGVLDNMTCDILVRIERVVVRKEESNCCVKWKRRFGVGMRMWKKQWTGDTLGEQEWCLGLRERRKRNSSFEQISSYRKPISCKE